MQLLKKKKKKKYLFFQILNKSKGYEARCLHMLHDTKWNFAKNVLCGGQACQRSTWTDTNVPRRPWVKPACRGHRGSPSSPSSHPGCRCTDPDKAALLWAAQRDCCAPVPGALMLWLRPCAHAGTRGRGRESKGGDANTSGICKTLQTLITSWEKCTGHIEERALCTLCYHTCSGRYAHPHNCVPTTATI